MTPAVLTVKEARDWLRSIGLTRVRLPKFPRVLYVDQPGPIGGLWLIREHVSGGFCVEPYRSETTAR